MATVTTEAISRHPVHSQQTASKRGRPQSRLAPPTSDHKRPNAGDFPRAASYHYLPHAVPRGDANSGICDVGDPTDSKGVASSSDLSKTASSAADLNISDDEDAVSISPRHRLDVTPYLPRSSATPWRDRAGDNTRSSAESSTAKSRTSLISTSTTSTADSTPASSHRSSLSNSKRFSRRSWRHSINSTPSPSRSRSPKKEDHSLMTNSSAADVGSSLDVSEGYKRSLLSRRFTARASKDGASKKPSERLREEQESDQTLLQRRTTLREKAVRTATGLFQHSYHDAGLERSSISSDKMTRPAVVALPKSFSTDRLPKLRSPSTTSLSGQAVSVPVLPSCPPGRTYYLSPLPSLANKKDELWSVFRNLDADFAKFSSKPISLKANVVRSSLIPFARTYACHSSNNVLRPEDLDRRANILNKWWLGLIDMLHGPNNQSISGTDRPVILDGVSAIMERPEWRVPPSQFCPLKQRVKASMGHYNRSNTSFGSSSSDFLADSIYHNVRNTFVQNLTSQMAFVVDKMSLRHAPSSLVTFCGKACAYAFMFVPGVADVLVRLWNLQTDNVRRVLHEYGIGKFEQILDQSDILANFPPALHRLSFESLTSYMRKLRNPQPLPPGTAKIPWWGHWVNRWSGRESDLFYVFAKCFHILTADFLLEDTTKQESMCAPGMLSVHAQILANLDATVHRDTNQNLQSSATAAPAASFDELLSDHDAVAPALPMPHNNAVRLMAENRLIILIRDFLSERTAEHPIARELFAQSFSHLLQAAARGTSVYDHSACYTLLDFLEEALLILNRYEQLRQQECSLVDFKFWLSVCRKMIDSENTVTEIRLYAFLYSTWHTVVAQDQRKSDLCMSLLLDPKIFESRFNHWCPMVRAYFMRLLCWRVARYDDENFAKANAVRILWTMQERLHETWNEYLYLCDKAHRDGSLPPDTAPCHPAPGRRLVIVKTDHQINNGGKYFSLDGLLKDLPPTKNGSAWIRNLAATNLLEGQDLRPDSSSTVDSECDRKETGIGGFIRKMIGGSKIRAKYKEPPRASSAAEVDARPLAADAHLNAQSKSEDSTQAKILKESTPQPTEPPQYRSLSFRFSLELHSNTKQLPPLRLHSPKLPLPAQTFLQTHPKDACLSSLSSTLSNERNQQNAPNSRYRGRALAEWSMVLAECHSFFERRKDEGVPNDTLVETPTLGVEVFKKPS